MSETAEVVEPVSEEDVLAAEMTPELEVEDGVVEEDEEPDDDFEEDEPPAAYVQSEKEIEKSLKALEKEAKRHAERVRAIMGDEANSLVSCEACEELIPGFHYHADFYEPGSAERALAEMLAGGTDGIMQHPTWLEVCPDCNGYGQLLTGSRVDLTRLLGCPTCKQAGYLNTRENAPATPVTTPNGEASIRVVPASSTDEAERDMWGRPRGHAHFGTFPIYLSDEERASDLAEGFTV